MNRLHFPAGQAQRSEKPLHDVAQAKFSTSSENSPHHALFVPLHYEPNYAYPLIVWLHGPADDERQLLRVMPLISMRNYVAVGPRGVCAAEETRRGYCWSQSDTGIGAAEQAVFQSIEAAKRRCNIAAARVFVAGFLCGGTMALRLGMKHPEQFAGALSIGGPFPNGKSPLARIAQARDLPLFIAQGRDAVKYSVGRTCADLRLFHAAGLSVTLRQYPGGDELGTQMLHDMDVWLMEQVTGVSMTSDDDGQCWPTEWN